MGHGITGRLGFTGNHREGRTFAHTVKPFAGMDPDKNILGIMHGSRSNGKRMHGNTELINIGMGNFHIVGCITER